MAQDTKSFESGDSKTIEWVNVNVWMEDSDCHPLHYGWDGKLISHGAVQGAYCLLSCAIQKFFGGEDFYREIKRWDKTDW